MTQFSICFLARILQKVRKKSRNHDLPICVPESDLRYSDLRSFFYGLTVLGDAWANLEALRPNWRF